MAIIVRHVAIHILGAKEFEWNIVDWEVCIGTIAVHHGAPFGRHEHASSAPSRTSKSACNLREPV